jgi:molybdopterin converting factor small subunit
VKILLFGALADSFGNDSMELNHALTVQVLREELASQFPELSDQLFMLTVNQKQRSEDYRIQISDEIALLPPFAGG